MRMKDNNNPKKETPYGIASRQPVNAPGRGVGRFAERNVVTGVEFGQSTVNPINRLGRPTRTAEDVQKTVDQKIAEYEKRKKRK